MPASTLLISGGRVYDHDGDTDAPPVRDVLIEAGRIVSMAAIIAVGVNTDGRREVLGVATGPSEAETFWKGFLRSLADRGLRGVKLVIADDHKGLRAAASRVFHATIQRCRVHSCTVVTP